ncbi:MAG: Rpn family recombination-promoting nuclease/putative transposase, partial [Desulfovermiculus sp.]
FHVPSEGFRQYVPKFEHLLHDISHIDEEQFKSTTLLRIVQLIMKYIDHPEQTYKLPEIVSLLQQLQDKDKITEYLALILQYVLRTGAVTIQQAKEIVRELPHGEETVETTADVLRKEGEQRGQQRGELKKTRDLLLRNINARFGTINRDLIERIKAIQSVEVLDGLFDLSLRVSSFDEFKEQVLRAADN